MPKKSIVFRHLQQEGACNFGRFLDEAEGWDIQTISVPRYYHQGVLDDFDPLEPDLLIVMGGNIGVYQADDFPFIHDEMKIMEKRMAAEKPLLSVCLGSQMLAKVLGADVYPGDNGQEIGWYDLSLRDDVPEDHPVREICAPNSPMFHWHGDTFDLPQGAKLLASSENYTNQIYEYGDHAIGLQCHPEVFGGHVQEWFVMGHKELGEQKEGKTVHQLRAETAENIGTLNQQSTKFLHGWLRKVGLEE